MCSYQTFKAFCHLKKKSNSLYNNKKVIYTLHNIYTCVCAFLTENIYRRFNAIVSQLKMHYFSEGAFESLIA